MNSGSGESREQRILDARKKRLLTRSLWVAVLVVALGALIWWLVSRARQSSGPLPGAFFRSVGREHIGLNDSPPVPYNSNPPSSGAHFSSPANWGTYDYEVDDRIFLHNLEHGGVWVAYRASTTPSGVLEDLKDLVREFGGSKIVMAPRSANDADLSLVAWTRVQNLTFSGDRLTDRQKNAIREFYRAWKNRGPEFVPDSMPGVDPKSVQ